VADIYTLNTYRYEKENNETRIACHNSWYNMCQLCATARRSKAATTSACTCNTIREKPLTSCQVKGFFVGLRC
jgi:hypothetical protein